MDAELVRLMAADTPQLNPRLANGLATEQMQLVERHIDEVFKSAAKGFPEGLQYLGCQRCTPQEEYAEVVRSQASRRNARRNTKKTFETARSDIYLMKYFLSLRGEALPPKYIYVPFVSQAGSISISGSKFNISPVLSDRVISIGENSIFVRFMRDRVTFHRTMHSFMVNDRREIDRVAYSQIYHVDSKNPRNKPGVKAETCVAHYLFCKYGFTETFKRFANCEPVVAEEFDPVDFPPEQWLICSSMQVRPKGVGKAAGVYYDRVKVKVAIRREEYTPFVRALLVGFYYVVDHFPTQMTPEYVDNPRQWMILMGYLLFSANAGAGELYRQISHHISSLDEYLDNISKSKLEDIGIHVNDTYEFLAVLLSNYNTWVLEGIDKLNSMYNKELTVLYYALFDITNKIFRFLYDITAAARKELTIKDVENNLNKNLKTGLIYRLNKEHGEVAGYSYSGDNKAFKITSTLVPQGSTNKGGKGKGKGGDRGAVTDPTKTLHVSIAEIGSYCGMPKNDPSGRERLNHHALIDHKGVVVRNPKFVKLLDEVQAMITQK